jgi:hypothetical protein
MPKFASTIWSLRASLAFLLVVSTATGFLLGAYARPMFQVSVESGQVLAGIVTYPAGNPFYIYHLKLWTIVNQLLALALTVGLSERTLSILVSGAIAGLSYGAVALCVFAASKNAFWGIAAPFLIDFTRVQPALAVNYPIDFMGTPHTYGVVGLAWSLMTLSWIALERYPVVAGLFLGLAPAVHPAMGVWCWIVLLIVLVWDRSHGATLVRAMWKPAAAGISVSAASLLLQLYWMRGAVPVVDSATQTQYISEWIQFFDFHRRPVYIILPGVQLGAIAIVLALLLIVFWDDVRDAAPRFLLRTVAVASALALTGAAISRLPPSLFPQSLLTLMPTRVFLLGNLAFVAVLLGTFARYTNLWVRITALLCIVLIVFGNEWAVLYALVFAGGIIAIWRAVSLTADAPRPTTNTSTPVHLLIGGLIAVLVAALALQGIWVRLEEAPLRQAALIDRTVSPLFAEASKSTGLIAIGTRCCAWTQLRTRRPVLVETGGLDQIMYAPESAPAMNTALKAVYGVDLLNPDEILRSAGFDEDLTPVAKPLWEARTTEEWKALGRQFGFTSVLTSGAWTLQLPEAARDSELILYRIP